MAQVAASLLEAPWPVSLQGSDLSCQGGSWWLPVPPPRLWGGRLGCLRSGAVSPWRPPACAWQQGSGGRPGPSAAPLSPSEFAWVESRTEPSCTAPERHVFVSLSSRTHLYNQYSCRELKWVTKIKWRYNKKVDKLVFWQWLMIFLKHTNWKVCMNWLTHLRY